MTGANSASPSGDDTPARLTFREKLAAEIRKQDNGTRVPDMGALDKAMSQWAEKCTEKRKGGVIWSMTNIDPILELYDMILLSQQRQPTIDDDPGV